MSLMYWNRSVDAGNFSIIPHHLAFQPGSRVCLALEGCVLGWQGQAPDLMGFRPSPAAVIKSIGLNSAQATLLQFSIRKANSIFRLSSPRALGEDFAVHDEGALLRSVLLAKSGPLFP